MSSFRFVVVNLLSIIFCYRAIFTFAPYEEEVVAYQKENYPTIRQCVYNSTYKYPFLGKVKTECGIDTCFAGIFIPSLHKKSKKCWRGRPKIEPQSKLNVSSEGAVSLFCQNAEFCVKNGSEASSACYDFERSHFDTTKLDRDVIHVWDDVDVYFSFLNRGPFRDPFRREGWKCRCWAPTGKVYCAPKYSPRSFHEKFAGCYWRGSFLHLHQADPEGHRCVFIGYVMRSELSEVS